MKSLLVIGVLALAIVNSCAAVSSIQLSNIHVQWEIRGDKTHFKLTTPLGNGVIASNAWIGLGLSEQNAMVFYLLFSYLFICLKLRFFDCDMLYKYKNGASVAVCKKTGSLSAVHHYYNDESSYASNLFDEERPTLGITNGVVSVSGGNLTCSFARDNSHTVDGYFRVRPGHRAFILIAYGEPKSNGDIQYHAFRTVSDQKVDFAANSLKRTTTGAKNSYKNGQFSLSWTVKADVVDFEFTLSNVAYKTNFYSAFAFSKDNYMGNDDVNVCIFSDKVKDVHHYCNEGKVSSIMVQAMPTYGYSNSRVSFANKLFTCKFSRKTSLISEKYFDLSKPYFILLAHGPTTASGSIRKHIIKTASGQKFQVISSAKRSAINKKARN